MILPNQLISVEDLFLGKKRPRKILKKMQDIERALTTMLSLIIINKYKWDGLPKELKEREYIIEYILFWYGSGVLLKRNDKYFFLPAYLSSSLNIYGEPTRVHAYGLNGYDMGEVYIRDEYDENLRIKHKQDSVLFKNNINLQPQYFYSQALIKRLVYIWQSLGIQNGLSRIKLLIYANQDLSGKVDEIINNILGESDLTYCIPTETGANLLEDVHESNFNGTYNPTDLWFDFDKTFNLLLSLNGIKNNIESNKKERQTIREVSSGDYFTNYASQTREQTRNIAVEQCKTVFDLDLSYEDIVEKKMKEEELKYLNNSQGIKNDTSNENDGAKDSNE